MVGLVRTISLLAVLVAGLAPAACGEGEGDTLEDKKAYVAKVDEVQTRFAAEVTSVTTQYTARSSARRDRRTLRSFESAIDRFVAQLRAIEAPRSIRAEHTQLVAAMSGYAAEIAQANAVLSNPTTRALAEASERMRAATETVNTRLVAARNAINAKLNAQ